MLLRALRRAPSNCAESDDYDFGAPIQRAAKCLVMALSVVSLRCGIWSAIGAYRTSSSNQARFMATRPSLPRTTIRGERWISCRPGFFLPVRLSRLFRRLSSRSSRRRMMRPPRFFGNHARLIEPSDADEPPMHSLHARAAAVIETFERGSAGRRAALPCIFAISSFRRARLAIVRPPCCFQSRSKSDSSAKKSERPSRFKGDGIDERSSINRPGDTVIENLQGKIMWGGGGGV